MMSGFPLKLVAAALAVLLLVGDLQASSAILLNDGENSLWWVPGCKSGSRKTFPAQKDCVESESSVNHDKKTVPFWSLRSASPPPPTPTKSPLKRVGGCDVPPQAPPQKS